MTAVVRPSDLRFGPRRIASALIVAGLLVAYLLVFYHHPPRTTAVPATTTPTLGLVTSQCAPPVTPVKGIAALACPSPVTPWGSAPPMVLPHGAPPKTLEAGDLIEGFGPPAKIGDQLVVQYEMGTYSTHRILQSSWLGGAYSFDLGRSGVVAGFDRAVVGMRAGGRREIVVPPSLGYGATSPVDGVAPNDTLVFLVDVFKIN